MLKKLKEIFSKKEELGKVEDAVEEVKEERVEALESEKSEEKEGRNIRPLTPQELEIFKQGMGITPHNYWTWAGRTNNFKLLTDGEYVWVEGFEDHIGKQLPLTQQRAWSWEFIRQRLRDFGGQG